MQPSPPKKIRWLPAMVRKLFGTEFAAGIEHSSNQFSETVTTTALTGNGVDGARTRQVIYQKYQQMSADPLVSGAIRLHVTSALGGHETSGDLVFIETRDAFKEDPAAEKLVTELSAVLGPIFNRAAIPIAYNGAIYGDAYARLYTKDRVGITDMSTDEMMLPPMVLPFEQGNMTRICKVATGAKAQEKLTMDQIARMKMPRMIYTPQPLAVEKAWRMAVTENDVDKLPLMPGLVGGSFLADAEQQYDKFVAALQGLVGQRVLDSIDESIFTAQVTGMTKEQTQTFLASLTKMLKKSKAVADEAVRTGRPFLGRIRHILPVWGEKQLLGIQGVNSGGGSGSGRSGTISIEDVLFHAKLLAGALGIDLSMLGFADLMSGGLGEGGFFRTSAQAAERSRTIRVALTEFFNHCIDVHLIKRTGQTYAPEDRPWQVNFFGSISALEKERTATQLDAVNAGTLMAQCFTMAKDLGLDVPTMSHFFERVLKLDATEAKMYAKAVFAAKQAADAKEAAQNAGGGFGGGGDGGGGGGPPPGIEEDDAPPADEKKPKPGAPKPIPVAQD